MKNILKEHYEHRYNSPEAQAIRDARDPELDKLIQAEGRGRNPFGFYEDQNVAPMLIAARHNPYMNMFLGFLAVGMSIFLFTRDELSALNYIFGALAAIMGFIIILQNLIRAPSWHRARRVAKAYIAKHGGKLPYELRIIS